MRWRVAGASRRRSKGQRPGRGSGGISTASGAASLIGEGAIAASALGEDVVSGAIYVSLTGNDTTGDGTILNPYRSLTKAVDVVTAGQTIYLRGGTYDTPGTDAYYTDLGGGAGERTGYLDLRGKATSGNRIAIRSYPGELAIIDGINSSLQPRSFLDGLDPEEPYLMKLIGEYVDISHLTFKRSAGKGLTLFGNHCTIRNVHTHSHHSDGLYIQGEENVIEELDAHHNYGVATQGNNGDGVKMLDYGSTLALFFGAGARTRNNTFRRCRFWLNSDDGIDTWNAPGTLLEDCVSFNNGYDSNGNGMGYKFGMSTLSGSGNTARRCIGVRNKDSNFTTNDAVGDTFEWCTSYQPYGEIGFYFKAVMAAQDGSDGYNTGRNNVSYGALYNATPTAVVPAMIVYQNNTWNLGISNPSFASTTPSSADFLKLSAASDCIDAATDGTDLGAIQYGGSFPVPMTPCSMSFTGSVPFPYSGSDAYPDWPGS